MSLGIQIEREHLTLNYLQIIYILLNNGNEALKHQDIYMKKCANEIQEVVPKNKCSVIFARFKM